MHNVKTQVKGNFLILAIDLTESCGLSSTGKSEMVAKTGGFTEIPETGGLEINLNLRRPIPKEKRQPVHTPVAQKAEPQKAKAQKAGKKSKASKAETVETVETTIEGELDLEAIAASV